MRSYCITHTNICVCSVLQIFPLSFVVSIIDVHLIKQILLQNDKKPQ